MSGTPKNDIAGKRFGRLTVAEINGRSKDQGAMWSATCDCGTVVSVRRSSLVAGHSKSCGCLKKDSLTKRVGKLTSARLTMLQRRASEVVEAGTRVCTGSDCSYGGVPQTLDKFPFNKKSLVGVVARCKECIGNYQLLTRYGISRAGKREMMRVQGGICAIPGCVAKLNTIESSHVDHCHATGRVRGILCSACNTSLGLLEESRERIMGLVSYLDSSLP